MRVLRGLICVVLAGCGGAGHLGNPALLPVAAIATSIDNQVYGARRARVRAHLAAHGAAALHGSAQAALWRIAGTPAHHRAKVLRELAALPPGPDWAESATIIVMVHS